MHSIALVFHALWLAPVAWTLCTASNVRMGLFYYPIRLTILRLASSSALKVPT